MTRPFIIHITKDILFTRKILTIELTSFVFKNNTITIWQNQYSLSLTLGVDCFIDYKEALSDALKRLDVAKHQNLPELIELEEHLMHLLQLTSIDDLNQLFYSEN